jgi:hypothetical protein
MSIQSVVDEVVRLAPTRNRGSSRWATGIVLCLVLGVLSPWAVAHGQADPNPAWDPQRYIRVAEIRPGMEAYCLTDYGEAGIERFNLRVLDVITNVEPGHDMILVMGLDERFKHTGPVAGCSGSPVYVEGRLAGALALGWAYAKDPVYGVTPIGEMLQVTPAGRPVAPALSLDFSKPISLCEVSEQLTAGALGAREDRGEMAVLSCPLLLSGLSAHACEELIPRLARLGFAAVSNVGGRPAGSDCPAAVLQPGAPLAVSLVTGDVMMDLLGTTTEVRGDRVYGFGHALRGCGATELPMAGGKIHTVICKVSLSSKLGSVTGILGTIVGDEATAVLGRIGVMPRLVPLTVRVDRYNDPEPRRYKCQVAYDRQLTSTLTSSVVAGVAVQRGALPPCHTVRYQAVIHLQDGRTIQFGNTSTDRGLIDPTGEITGALALLLNNPFQTPELRSVEVDLQILAENTSSRLWSVEVSNLKVRPGASIRIEAVVESFLKEKRKYEARLKVPENLPAGKYNLMLLGASEYEKFLRDATPYRFVARDDRSLVRVLNETLNYGRTRLYCLLVLAPGGIVLDGAELPDLPGTKGLLLQNARRPQAVQVYPHWIEETVETNTVVADKAVVPVVVER